MAVDLELSSDLGTFPKPRAFLFDDSSQKCGRDAQEKDRNTEREGRLSGRPPTGTFHWHFPCAISINGANRDVDAHGGGFKQPAVFINVYLPG